MSHELKCLHFIGGSWVDGPSSFKSAPCSGGGLRFPSGTSELVDRAVLAAEEAFEIYSETTRGERAQFLRFIAAEIEDLGEAISEIGVGETGLPFTRLEGERARTCAQLKMFADLLDEGNYLDRRYDCALPDRSPLPRPDLRLMQMPIGPVAIFGASNFPLAFSTAGGDTASALAAGCPVIVKAHQAHPGTSDLVAQAVERAISRTDLPNGVFSMLHGGSRLVGESLVRHPLIRAVGFTGSLTGGRALFDLCATRPEPIPFYGELGSVNPMFLLPGAVAKSPSGLAQDWVGSLTLGVGQFCTNPGIVIAVDNADTGRFIEVAKESLSEIKSQIMLTDGIAKAYQKGQRQMASTSGVKAIFTSACDGRQGSPNLYEISGDGWLANQSLGQEVFGPLGLIIKVTDQQEMIEIARHLEGQLTCTLHLVDDDLKLGHKLMSILTRKAGRVLANSFPTGVEVCDSMVHGGPYPASTNFGATSVGGMAIRRFLRPVCFQNMPESLLPDDLSSLTKSV